MCERMLYMRIYHLNKLIEQGDPDVVEKFITSEEINPDDNFRYFSWRDYKRMQTPVCLAVRLGNLPVLKILLDVGLPMDENPTFDTIFPSNLAAAIGNLELLQYFEKRGISLNQRFGLLGESALHAAALEDQVEVCKFLLLKGVDVNFGDYSNCTPLMYTARHRSYLAARFLLDAGADVNAVDRNRTTAFQVAANSEDLKMMKLLVSRGADPENVSTLWGTCLEVALTENRYEMACYLVNELNVDLNLPVVCDEIDDEKTYCRFALQNEQYDMVRLFINAGYDPSVELASLIESDESDESGSDEDESDDSCDSSSQHMWFVRRKTTSRKKTRSPSTYRELQELHDMTARPRSLISLCALTIRRVLGRRLPVDLERLPVPEILKQEVVTCGVRKQESCIPVEEKQTDDESKSPNYCRYCSVPKKRGDSS